MKTRVPGEKPSKHRRDQLRERFDMKTITRLGFSSDKHNALTVCATCAPQILDLHSSKNRAHELRGERKVVGPLCHKSQQYCNIVKMLLFNMTEAAAAQGVKEHVKNFLVIH